MFALFSVLGYCKESCNKFVCTSFANYMTSATEHASPWPLHWALCTELIFCVLSSRDLCSAWAALRATCPSAALWDYRKLPRLLRLLAQPPAQILRFCFMSRIWLSWSKQWLIKYQPSSLKFPPLRIMTLVLSVLCFLFFFLFTYLFGYSGSLLHHMGFLIFVAP